MFYKNLKPRIHSPKVLAGLRAQIEAAHKFVFAPAARDAIDEIMANVDENPALLDTLIHEPTPFPATYVEVLPLPDKHGNERLGYGHVFLGDRIYTIAAELDSEYPLLLPFECVRRKDETLVPEPYSDHPASAARIITKVRDTELMLGSAGLRRMLDVNDVNLFLRHVRLSNGLPVQEDLDPTGRLFVERFKTQSVEFLIHPLATLSVLNRRSLLTVSEQPATSRIVAGKRVATPKHAFVDIHASQAPILQKALGPLGHARKSPEAHDVRATWVHYHVDAACEHIWPPEPTIGARYYCASCGGFRVRRRSHSRGGVPSMPKPYLVNA